MRIRIGMSIAAVLFVLAGCGSAFAATVVAAGYTATDQTTYGFQNIASTGARILGGMDDATAAVDMGFPFLFYGQAYSSLCISTNGLVAFGPCNMDFANVDLTSASPSGDARIVAPFWTDLNFSTAGSDAVYYQLLGVAPSRQFVVQWNAAFPLNSRSGGTFQAIFYEGTNQIRFQYLSVGACGNGSLATVGIRDAGGHLNDRRLQWSYRAPVLKDALALLFSPSAGPGTEYEVRVTVAPPAGGTVTGAGKYPAGSNATLTATANPGYRFDQWSGGGGRSTANPLTFRVDRATQVVANFARLVPVIAASVDSKTGDSAARLWTILLQNSGPGAASDTQLTGLTITPVSGSQACTTAPSVTSGLPVDYGLLAARDGSAARPVTINFSGCPTATRFTVRVDFQANGGTYQHFTVLNDQFQ